MYHEESDRELEERLTQSVRSYDTGIKALNSADYQVAAEILKESAEPKDAQTMYNWGVVYINGMGVKRDPVKAFSWFQKAYQKGYPGAARAIGCMYLTGDGIEKNEELAFEPLKYAADNGDHNAQEKVGNMLYNGIGVKQDKAKAVLYYKQAVSSDYLHSCFMYGEARFRGNLIDCWGRVD